MKNRRLQPTICLVPLLGFFTFTAASQIVEIDYTATVHELSGDVPAGVALGSTITGRVLVDLQYLPPDCEPTGTRYGCYDYVSRAPGYLFSFNTGVQSITLDSTVSAQDAGISPGIYLYNLDNIIEPYQVVNIQARSAGKIWGVGLRFADTNAPFTLLSGDRFPQDVNLAGSSESSLIYIGGVNAHGEANSFRADLTSVSMTITPARSPCERLIDQVNGADLSPQRRGSLLAVLEVGCAAGASGHCERELRLLRAFQNQIDAQIRKNDPALAYDLTAAAQKIIDAGCAE